MKKLNCIVSPFQTITTKYLGPTTFKGARIKATTSSGLTHTVSYDSSLNSDDNHAKAARELADKLEWAGTYVGGSVKNGYVFVALPGS